jgi:hypothetical protein
MGENGNKQGATFWWERPTVFVPRLQWSRSELALAVASTLGLVLGISILMVRWRTAPSGAGDLQL